jgi:hypothetical protein
MLLAHDQPKFWILDSDSILAESPVVVKAKFGNVSA